MTKDDNYKAGNQWTKRISKEQLIFLIDEVDSNTTYVGHASPGSLTDDNVWRIKKISVSGTVTSIKYADSNELFDNVWDDRATLIYG
jgi:hypothetical protein